MKKKHIFYILLFLPMLFLSSMLAWTYSDIKDMEKGIDLAIFQRRTAIHIHKKGISFPPVTFKHFAPGVKSPVFEKNIFVFGGSSMAMSENKTGANYLNDRIQSEYGNVLVSNWSISGMDTFSVKARVSEAYETGKPDIIFIYSGHNDYTNMYQHALNNEEMSSMITLLKVPYLVHYLRSFKKYPPGHLNLQFDNYVRNISPILFNQLQFAGLLDLTNFSYDKYNRYILSCFRKNMTDILKTARTNGTPIIISTLISNLYSRPYGDINIAEKYYELGLAANDYTERFNHLSLARDADIFSYNIRAKSPMNEFIRTLEVEGVYVFDIEKLLMERQFEFDDTAFGDYVHLNDSTHKIFADLLYDFIIENKILDKDEEINGNLHTSNASVK